MITEAWVTLQCGRVSLETSFKDSRGIAVGNSYMLNLDGRTAEWKIVKIRKDADGDDGKAAEGRAASGS